MSAAAEPRRRSGYRITAWLVALALLVLLGFLILAMVRSSGAADRFGSVDIPGSGELDLDRGEVTAYFEEARDLADHEVLRPPSDLSYVIRPSAGGAPLEPQDTESEQLEADNEARVTLAAYDVPEDGAYTVEAQPLAEDRESPKLVFGDNSADVFGDEIKPGLLIGGALAGLATLIGVATYLRRRLIE